MSQRVSTALVVELLAKRPIFRRKDLALRYGVTERTIDRWKEDGTLPPPKYVQGQFWTAEQIAKLEAEGHHPSDDKAPGGRPVGS